MTFPTLEQNQLSPAHSCASPGSADAADARPGRPADADRRAADVDLADWPWVPVRSLTDRHRERIAKHLLSLDVRDRFLRFGHPASDAQIRRYVDGLDFERDEVFGIFNRKVELVAAAHLAHTPAPQRAGSQAMAEFGVSVLPHARGRGFGARLFDHAILHARNRGVETLFIHALSENIAMLKIARKAGATVVRDGSESEAWLRLPPDTLASRFDELLWQRAAEIDYQVKWQVNRVHEFWNALSGGRLTCPERKNATNCEPGAER